MTHSTDSSSELDEPTIEWLIDELAPNPGNSPLINFNKERLRSLITKRCIAELEGQLANFYHDPVERLQNRLAELKKEHP